MSNKGSEGNFFEDFGLKQECQCLPPRLLTDADRVAYISFTGDRTPLFCDSAGLIHPLITFHTVLGQTVRQISLNAVANLGYAELIWNRPVHTGDELTSTVEIVGLKENSNRKAGIVYARTIGRNQSGDPVLSYYRWVMVRKNGEKETPYLAEPVIPELASVVSADRLPIPPSTVTEQPRRDGFMFEEYVPGERIFHIDGTTVNSSDHMSFTRLYQNSARVHFDALQTAGKPLVYGGLPISIGYAQSLNGLESRLGIAAINSGSHSNPIYAGDTLYSYTEVIDAADLNRAFGALRLRLICVKNEQPTNHFQPMRPDGQNHRYHPNVVLDLDYWELMPKKKRS